jgi:DNA-binding CsgD family transcriptional regulator/tetratricopeptide (TPR) repeat protein
MAAPPTSKPVGAFELLERTEHLAMLAGMLTAVTETGSGRVVFVAGEAGVGKTTLLRRFLEEVAGGPRILSGACDPLFTPRPLGAFFEIAEQADGELESLFEDGGKPYEFATALVRELRRRSPVVLVLEDVHWADEATLDVVRLIARRVDAVPALVLASYRDDELGNAQPLRTMIGDLCTSPTTSRLKLEPLSSDAVASLAEPFGVDAGELYERTTGNPFFVTEVLASGGEVIPSTVRDAVLARAARLEPKANRVLEAVAVAPPHAELWLLEALADDDLDHLDRCVSSGMLRADSGSVAFRHELARLAIEESLSPSRRAALHRRALRALSDPPTGQRDLTRLAHHAEAAGDVKAVLSFAPEAAERATSVGAHREAAAHYAVALRFGDRLPAAERADLLERRSHSCSLTDHYDEAIAATEEELELRRALGDSFNEGAALQRLSQFHWCPGRTAEAERLARDSVTLLEELPPSLALGWAYWNLGSVCASATLLDEAIAWSEKACELAARLGDAELVTAALGTIGGCRGDYELLEWCLEDAQHHHRPEQIGGLYLPLSEIAVTDHRCDQASRYLDEGITYASERGFEVFRLYLLASRARFELDQGRWTDAADAAASVLRTPRTSTMPRIIALAVLGLVRARRGDPEVWPLLDESWALAEPTGELPRLGPIVIARAEAAWLQGRSETVAEEAAVLELAVRRRAGWVAGPLAVWRRRSGIRERLDLEVPEPYALELAGDAEGAARAWTELGCLYEAALALAHADDTKSQRLALARLQSLGARPAAAIVARRLREQGARGLPRGPRPSTQANPVGLTVRELEVLTLLADGLRNAEIAERLVLSQKTVDHHVSAILRKLDARSRGQAAAEAIRIGLVDRDS